MNLTSKEWQVVFDLCDGKLPQEIADATGSSLKTIRNQIQKLHQKFNVTATHQIVVKVFQNDPNVHPALRFNQWLANAK